MQKQNPQQWAASMKEYAIARRNIAENKRALLEARAVIVRQPENVIELSRLQAENIEIEVLNNVPWPWTSGTTIGLAKNQTE